ncbi:MAG: CRISPR-associated protein Cas4 [Brevinematales bacterium]|jgi:CRISPR-associated exonuclease Cas4
MYSEPDLIAISALQHFIFCPRQCALIHIEAAWEENSLTAQGRSLHERAHSETEETRPDCKRVFGMQVRSLELGLSGQCDCVLETSDGKMIPLEYKRGKPKVKNMDTVQLCAQSLCLEEMTGNRIDEGFIYYFKIKKRLHIILDEALRSLTKKTTGECRDMISKGVTPPPVYSKKCESCSLKGPCMPEIMEKQNKVNQYIDRMIKKDLSD